MPKTKTAKTFRITPRFSYAFCIEGVDPSFFNRAWGRQLDDLRKIQNFVETAKSYHIGAKGKATMASVKAWVKENQPSNFYAKWGSDSKYYKDDSVEIFYDTIAHDVIHSS